METAFNSRNCRGIAAAVLASLLAFAGAFPAAFADTTKAGGYAFFDLNIAPGKSGADLGFAWLSTSAGKAAVQIAKAAYRTGSAFPAAQAKTFTGTQGQVSATLFNGDDASAATGQFANKVTVTGLADSTSYVYRVGDGREWSDTFAFATQDEKSFGFFIVGDPQLGAKSTGPKTLDSDTAGWADTVAKATGKYPTASFLVSLGDQVNDYNKRETQDAEYLAYFSPAQLRALPAAVIEGNHDFQMGEYYGYHYNQPDLSTAYGTSYGNDGDYWFAYGNALFLMLNSNTESVATHDLFMRKAIAKNPDAKWRIVAFHHSIYSEAEHFTDPDVVDRRNNYAPIMDRYKIDVVLQGHDHEYTRTFQMLGGKPQVDQAASADGAVADPTGTLYVTFNSGSGSKFYDWKDQAPEVFSAARWQGKVPSFGYVELKGGSLKLSVYRTDDMSVVDSYSIEKTK
jgi:3',5'-cyclic AMP phosphodiesterase CpdA